MVIQLVEDRYGAKKDAKLATTWYAVRMMNGLSREINNFFLRLPGYKEEKTTIELHR